MCSYKEDPLSVSVACLELVGRSLAQIFKLAFINPMRKAQRIRDLNPGPSEPSGNAQPLSHGKELTLLSFDGMDSVGSLLRSDYSVCGREVHVADAGNGDAALGHLVRVPVLRDQGLQLLRGHLQ